MNSTTKLETRLEDQLFGKVKIRIDGSNTIVKEGAGIIPQGNYFMSKEELESMIRKRIIHTIKIVRKEFGGIKIRTGSNTIVKEGRIIPNGHYLANIEEVESMISNRIFRDYMGSKVLKTLDKKHY